MSPLPVATRAIMVAITILVMLLGYALRLYQLGAFSVWYDESVSIWLAGLDPANIIARTAIDIHPPGYYLLLHFWLLATGKTEFAITYFSVAFGMLIIALAYRFGRALYPRSVLVAPLAALLVAFSPFEIWYSQEIRMYTLGAFLGLASTYFLYKALRDELVPMGEGSANRGSPFVQVVRSRHWLGYSISVAAGFYTLYYLAFLIISLNLFVIALWLLRRYRSSVLRGMVWRKAAPERWVIGNLLALALYTPWLPIAIQQAIWPPVPPWRSYMPWGEVVENAWQVLVLGQSVEIENVRPVLIVFAVIYALGIIPLIRAARRWGQDWVRGFLILTYTLVPVLVIQALSQITPLYFDRYLFAYAPSFSIGLAVALAAIAALHRWFGKIALIAVLAGTLATFGYSTLNYYTNNIPPAYMTDDLRSAIHYLDERVRPGDAILLDAGYSYPALLYYYRGQIIWRGRLTTYAGQPAVPPTDPPGAIVLQGGSITNDKQLGGGNPNSDFYPTSQAEVTQDLTEVAQHHPRLWLVRIYDTVTDPKGEIRDFLKNNFLMVSDQVFSGSSYMRVQLYLTHNAPQATPPQVQHPASVNMGDKLTFLGYDLLRRSAPAGGDLYPILYWKVDQSIMGKYRLFVRLVGSDGYVWALNDVTPIGDLFPSLAWRPGEVLRDPEKLDIPPGTPPGKYHIDWGMYDPQSGRLVVFDAQHQATGNTIDLGEVEVTRPEQPAPAQSIEQSIDHPLANSVDVGGRARLFGASFGRRAEYSNGDAVDLTLYWQTLAGGSDLTTQVQLGGSDGKSYAEYRGVPARGLRPASQWTPDEWLRDPFSLTIPAEAPNGQYKLVATLLDARNTPLHMPVEIGTITVKGPERDLKRPSTQYAQEAKFGDLAELIGYDLSATKLQPGGTIDVTLYWKALAKTTSNYVLFVHLLGPDGTVAAQQDMPPLGGARPTTSWIPGEYLRDPYHLNLITDAPAGTYTIELGFYDPARNGERLPAVDAAGKPDPNRRIVLQQTITVSK